MFRLILIVMLFFGAYLAFQFMQNQKNQEENFMANIEVDENTPAAYKIIKNIAKENEKQ